MPVEIEVPTEHLHETIHEAHHESTGHAGGHGHGGFTLGVALSSAILAVLAALAALFAGHYANDAMIERIEAGDKWSYYQAKSIKRNMLQSKLDTLRALDKPVADSEVAKLAEYENEKNDIQTEARELTEESEAHLEQHTRLAGSVTFFQIAIALGAIAVLTRKRALWLASLGVGVGGMLAVGYGFMPPKHAPNTEHGVEKGDNHESKGAHEAKAEHGDAKAGEHVEAKPEHVESKPEAH